MQSSKRLQMKERLERKRFRDYNNIRVIQSVCERYSKREAVNSEVLLCGGTVKNYACPLLSPVESTSNVSHVILNYLQQTNKIEQCENKTNFSCKRFSKCNVQYEAYLQSINPI
jgi:hypothetical protein